MKAVNLLPPDLRGAPKRTASATPAPDTPTGVGAYIVLGALAMAVAALAVFVLAGNAVKDREGKLATVTAEAQNARQRAAALKPYADFEALRNQRATTVRSLAEARFDWNRALQDLSRALPQDATLSEVTGNVTPGSAAGASDNPLRGELSAPAISLKGCVQKQTGVARVLSNLRGIDGVTRVTLSRSDKDAAEAASGGGAATGAGAPTAAYCGKGDPPTFDIVVFFERDAARVTSAPGVAAAGGTGAAKAPASGSKQSRGTTQAGGSK